MSTFIQFIHIFKKCINISTFFFFTKQRLSIRCLKQQGGWVFPRTRIPAIIWLRSYLRDAGKKVDTGAM